MADSNSRTDSINADQVSDEIRIQAVFGWLPKDQFLQLMESVYDVCQRWNVPPPGEAFEVGGVPYSSAGAFAECIVEETRELLFELATGERRRMLDRQAYGLPLDGEAP